MLNRINPFSAISAGTTQATSGTVVFSNSNGVSFGLSGNTVTASAVGGGAGISAGTQSVNSGTVVFSNSNGISFGMSNSSVVTATYTVPSTAGLISAVNVSAGTTSNNLSAITFSNSNGVSFGLNGSTLTGSVAAQSVQTQNCVDVTAAGNTAGTLALVSSGTLTIAGGNNITLSQNGNAITISGANIGGAQTGISGIAASGGTQTVGTVSFANSNGVTFGMSTGANTGTITASVAAQTNQTGNVYATSNTFGTSSGTYDARTLSLQGSGAVSVAASNSGWIVSAPVQTAESNTLGMSNLGNTSGTSGVVSGNQVRYLFAGGNNVTLSQSLNGASGTVTISAANQSVQTQNCVDAQIGGNTTGTTALISSGTMTIAGGNNITISQAAGNAITISAANLTNSSWTVSDNATSMTVARLAFTQSNGLTLSLSTTTGGSATVVGSYTVPSTAGLLSAINVSAGTTSNNLSNVVFSNSNNFSFGLNGSTITGSYTVPSVTNSSLTLSDAATSLTIARLAFTNSNGLTLTLSTTTGGSATLVGSYTVPTVTAGSDTLGMSNLGNTAGTSGVVSGDSVRYLFAGGNNVTLSQSLNGVSGTVTISAANQTVQTQNCVDLSLSGNTSGTLALISSGTAILAGGNNITLSQNGQSITISAGNASNNPVNFSAGTTSNNLGTVVFSNSNLVSFGLNGSTITGSVPNTSQLSATGWASLSTNGNTISIGASTTAQFYATGNTFGTSSGTGGIDSMSISGAGAVSVAASNSGWVVSAPQQATLSQYEILGDLNPQAWVTNSTLSQNQLYFVPFDVQAPLNAYRLNFFLSLATTVSAANSTGRGGFTLSAALYTRGTDSTDRINSFWSGTAGVAMTQNSNTQLVITNLAGISNSTQVSTVGTSLSTSNATTYPANSMGGFRVVPLPISSTLTPGRYWLAYANSTSSSNAGVCLLNASIMQMTFSNSLAFRPFGTSSAASNASFYGFMDGAGTYSATSGAFPSSIPLTSDSIRGAVSFTLPYCNFSGFTTGTNML